MSDATKRLINAAEWVVTIFTDDTLAHERGNLDDWLHDLNEAILEVEKEQQGVSVSDSVVDSIAQELAAGFDYPWEYMPQKGREDFRQKVRNIATKLSDAQKGI